MKETTEILLRKNGYNGEQDLNAVAYWLRYVHGISIEPVSTTTHGETRTYRAFVNSTTTIEGTDADTYEGALELGIIYSLKKLL